MLKRTRLLNAQISVQHAALFLLGLCGLLAALALALSVPGQMSMDTSVQLFEAHVGHSVSWNPPFMSAFLAWMGGGELATSLFVLVCVGLLYGSLAIVVAAKLRRNDGGKQRIQLWRVALAGALLLNPVIFIYSGIVWKDVLFASALAATIALIALATSVRCGRSRWIIAAGAIGALSVAALARQQGIVVAPPLLCAIALSVVTTNPPRRRQAALQFVGILALFLVSVSQLGAAANRTIQRSDDRGFSVGFQNIFDYDIAGIIYYQDTSRSNIDGTLVPKDVQKAIKANYSPFRIDFLFRDARFARWASHFNPQQRLRLWWHLLSEHPLAYLTHRIQVFEALLDLGGVEKCLPLQVGISGNPAYLKEVGIMSGTGQRGQLLYRVESSFFHTPVFGHWFDAIWLLGLLFWLLRARFGRREKLTMACVAIGALLLLLSYLPTSIACDYRYLFGLVPVATLMSLWLLLAPRKIEGAPESRERA